MEKSEFVYVTYIRTTPTRLAAHSRESQEFAGLAHPSKNASVAGGV